MEHAVWRLIVSPPPIHGAMNMATDEAILFSVGKKLAPPTLRLYSWQKPCLSLGFSQTVTDVDLDELSRFNWELVRRPTGGKAILHCDEITYAVIAPEDESRVQGSVLTSYLRLSKALLQSLNILGTSARADENYATQPNTKSERPVCFEVPSNYEITISGKKIIGSAQARRNEGVLQHGTLPLFGDLTRIIRVLKFDNPKEQDIASRRLLEHATTLETALGKTISWESARDAFINGFANALNLSFTNEPLTQKEIEDTEELFKNKYNHADWTFKR